MAEYKDVEPLKKQIADFKRAVKSENSDYLTGYISALSAVEGMIAGQPAADVAPVRHGKWIYNPNGMDFNLGAWECSVCTQKNNNLPCSRNISPYICVGSKYCPNCGAKMGGEGE